MDGDPKETQGARDRLLAIVGKFRQGADGAGPWPTTDEIKAAVVDAHLVATHADDAAIGGMIRRALRIGLELVKGAQTTEEAFAAVMLQEEAREGRDPILDAAGNEIDDGAAFAPLPYPVTPDELHKIAVGACGKGNACADPDCGIGFDNERHGHKGLAVAYFRKDRALQIVCAECGRAVARIIFASAPTIERAPRIDA